MKIWYACLECIFLDSEDLVAIGRSRGEALKLLWAKWKANRNAPGMNDCDYQDVDEMAGDAIIHCWEVGKAYLGTNDDEGSGS